MHKNKVVAVITDFKEGMAAKRLGADILELRFDLLPFKYHDTQHKNIEHLRNSLKLLKDKTKLPIILTIRSKNEGGKFTLDDTIRQNLYYSLIPFVDYVDLELSSKNTKNISVFSRHFNKHTIISYHNFNKTPNLAELRDIVTQASKCKPDIVKIATCISNNKDIANLFCLFREFSKSQPLSVVPMSKSSNLRLISLLLGSVLNYGYLRKPVAAGQLSIQHLKKFLNF